MTEAKEANQSASQMARQLIEDLGTWNPGPLGNEASSGLHHASTLGRLRPPGWRTAERGCVCVRVPVSPTLQCDGAASSLVPTGIAPETRCRGVSTSAPVRPRVCCALQHLFFFLLRFLSSARLSNVE